MNHDGQIYFPGIMGLYVAIVKRKKDLFDDIYQWINDFVGRDVRQIFRTIFFFWGFSKT